MSTHSNTGGMAYPVVGPKGVIFTGMTLRDYFAAQVIGAAYQDRPSTHDKWDLQARVAYAVADAMLTAREAKP